MTLPSPAGITNREADVLHPRHLCPLQALGVIHAERQNEPAKVAVVFGAAHIPAVVDYLTATFRYYVENAVWLTVAHAPD